MNKTSPKQQARPLFSATREETVTRSYPEAVYSMGGERIVAGKKVTLPAPTARRFEARWALDAAPLNKSK